MNAARSNTESPRPPWPLCLAAAALVGIPLGLANGVWTLLKETPSFWRDAGGYPVALRELVLVTYYPLLGIYGLLCVVFVVLSAHEHHSTGRLRRWTVVAGVTLWLLLAANVTLLTANNVENLFVGRDLHYHPPYP